MSASFQIQEWTTPLRDLAMGASIAVCILIPTGITLSQPVVAQAQPEAAELVTVAPDGVLDARFAFYRTKHGLETPTYTQIDIQVVEKEADEDILDDLRKLSGIPLETLTHIAGVSRNAYYKWARGGSIRPDNFERLAELRDAFRILRDVKGSEVRDFLESPGPAGRPIDLLASGYTNEVVGMAFRSRALPIAPFPLSPEARHRMGLPGRFNAAPRLAWNKTATFDEGHRDAWEFARPSIIMSQGAEDGGLDVVEQDEGDLPPHSVRGFFLE